ncbi:uncharacterized protein F4807DRAFT_60104 [Annulohypoxylon truncatum]|uniref:uncharacterized protein n=1 Tax=Annulohypoxylon truncatum TaxID=327061 RepID=UPI0020076ADD|nr:uncharacterized protein F4807DRAFT_60104 [Annulohypoxylon truncatum]KAI1210312.1 hypothetical protein F4807DRAFT_60104 [Annulohypoxylon truncatum]
MQQSRLLQCSLLIALGTIGIWATEDVGGVRGDAGSSPQKVAQAPRGEEPFLWNNFEHVVVEKDSTVGRLIVERIPDSTRRDPKEQAAPALTTPQPTAQPQKRQDDGQVQALSQQLQSLSQSATQALSSVSSSASSAMSLVSQSAQSVRQSADQAVRSANQNADDANRQLSQTISSASSALSAASARASDDLSRSLSSMSSRISSNLASAQSSANSAISAARAEASSSASNAVNIAASQIQEARADASGIRGDANSIVSQVQSNSVSGTNVAIIVTASVVGTAILTAIASYFVARYRRKKRRSGEPLVRAINPNNEKQQYGTPYEKPVAVRGSIASPSLRFTPFGGGTGYPMDKFKLPDLGLSPFLKKKTNEASPSFSDIGFARSNYSPRDGSRDGAFAGPSNSSNDDVYGVSPTSFRLQKENSVKSATSVRLIRVGSNKGKANEEDEKALLSPLASPPPPLPAQVSTAPVASVLARVPVPVAVTVPVPVQAQPQPVESLSPVEPQLAEPPPAAVRAVRNSETPEDPEPEPAPIKRSGTASTAYTMNTMTSQQRLRFRDSSDIESAEPSPATGAWRRSRSATVSSMRNTNTASLRTNTTSPESVGSQSPPRRPKNAGPTSFATFPRVRDGPPRGSAAEAIINRGRSGLNGVTARLREEAERRKRELDEVDSDRNSTRMSKDVSEPEKRETRGPNWPFGNS